MARDIAALILAVKAHAVDNYNKGWDVVVEACGDEELRELIGLARTEKGAIKKVAAMVNLRREVHRDIVAAGGVEEFYPDLFPTQEITTIPVVDVTSEVAPAVVPAEKARPVSELVDEDGYRYFPEPTETGVVCGRCSKEARADGSKEPVRHATAAHVRACYDADTQQREFADQQRAELEAEARNERFFEERGAHEPEEMDYLGWGLQLA